MRCIGSLRQRLRSTAQGAGAHRVTARSAQRASTVVHGYMAVHAHYLRSGYLL
eukprot:SAG11_NODE_36675_length_260_cov_0.968944_1_plen_52_part_01